MSVDNSSPATVRTETKPKRFDADPRDRNSATAFTVLVLVGAFGLVSGPVGLVVGLGTAGVWYAFGFPYAVGVGHVGLVAISLDGIGSFEVAVVELGFIIVFLASIRYAVAPRRVGVVALASGLVLGGTAWLTLLSQPMWLAATVFILLFALVGYGVHRYELVALGLVSEQAQYSQPDQTKTNE